MDKTQHACPNCGLPTRAKSKCRRCMNGESLPDVKTLQTVQLITYRAAITTELEARRSQLDDALGRIDQ